MSIATATKPQTKTGPTWLRMRRRHGVTDDFLRDPRRGCLDQQHVFWSDDLSDQLIALKTCASCPCFRDCTAWALYSPDCDTDYFIVAGLDPTRRLRIREGREDWHDWRREFNYARRAAKAASSRRVHDGVNKRDQRRIEILPCPGCGSNDVSRNGRDKVENRQKYQCKSCRASFLGEDL